VGGAKVKVLLTAILNQTCAGRPSIKNNNNNKIISHSHARHASFGSSALLPFTHWLPFFNKFEIDILNLSACYIQGQDRNQKNHITVKHYYHFDIFNTIIDFQL
jgi:hypothetical protein